MSNTFYSFSAVHQNLFDWFPYILCGGYAMKTEKGHIWKDDDSSEKMMWLYFNPIYLNPFLLNTLPCLIWGGLIARMSWWCLPKSLNLGGPYERGT